METLIEEIVQKLQALSQVKLQEVLNFVDFLAWNQAHTQEPVIVPPLGSATNGEGGMMDEGFEAIADRLADAFQQYTGATAPVLSDYAVSRAGIYGEHP